MPYKMTILETGKKVVSKCLLSAWHWKDSLPKLDIMNAQPGLNKVSTSGLSRIWNKSFAEYFQRVEEITLLNVVSVTS